ncbi:glycine-rich domain-containing protein [Brevundimonas sp. R86498]|uniref:glycine-rich domain-containing protein n=1 Tax=Brevundimonas sp. R86498 TaxID=3093845 RepID=UPI0037CC7CBE
MIEIEQSTQASLSGDQIARIQLLKAWNLAHLQNRICEKMGWTPGAAEEAVNEYRKFVGVVSLNPERPYGVTEAIDAVWHEHILNTRDYAAFCESSVGTFLHHEPQPQHVVRSSGFEELRANTVSEIRRVFAGPVSPLWSQEQSESVAKCCTHVAAGRA